MHACVHLCVRACVCVCVINYLRVVNPAVGVLLNLKLGSGKDTKDVIV